MHRRTIATLIVSSLLAPAASSAAEVSVYDDALGAGWKNDWGQSQSAMTLNNSASALMTGQPWGQNGQVVLSHTAGGQTLGENTLLKFYVNTSDSEAARISLKVNNLEYHPNNGGEYKVDGVLQKSSFLTDADPTTWQLVTFDLTQPRYYWNSGWQATNLTATDKITSFAWSQDNQFLIDSITMSSVPEPASLSLLGLGGLALLKRRKRTVCRG